jgi:nucleoside-diphosphate-sugar epimerase
MVTTRMMNENSRILITGGGGYLGSKLAEKILPSGAQCYLLDKAFNTISRNLASHYPNLHLVVCDLAEKEFLRKVCQEVNPDHVFHFAASIDRTRDFGQLEEMWKINVGGTLNLLEALKELNYSSFTFASTSDVYGTKNPIPFHEEQIPCPVSPYSITKLMAEELLRSWSALNNKPFTIYRIFLFIGQDMPPTTFIGQLVDSLVKNTEFHMTKGAQRRDYLALNDLLHCMITLTGNPDANGEIINLCSGNSISMKEIADNAQLIGGYRLRVSESLPYRENEIWEIRGANEKLLRLLPGFEPEPISKAMLHLFSILP